MRTQKQFIFSLMAFAILFVLTLAKGTAYANTTITLEQAVHFMTPDGSDVVVGSGTYEVEGQGEGLRLVSMEGSAPISIQAGSAPFLEEVESPVAMAIPIPDEGIYLALAMPGEAGLEAMGSYSGIQTRGRSLLNARKAFSPKYRQSLKSFAKQLNNNPKSPDLKGKWNELVQQGKRKSQRQGSTNVNAMYVSVLRQGHIQNQKDLNDLAIKLKNNLNRKKELREEIVEVRNLIALAPNDSEWTIEYQNVWYTKVQLVAYLEDLESKLQSLSDMSQLLQLDLQDAMNKQAQAMQVLSAILKSQHDTLKAIIGNLRQ